VAELVVQAFSVSRRADWRREECTFWEERWEKCLLGTGDLRVVEPVAYALSKYSLSVVGIAVTLSVANPYLSSLPANLAKFNFKQGRPFSSFCVISNRSTVTVSVSWYWVNSSPTFSFRRLV